MSNEYVVYDNDYMKVLRSENYNYNFNKIDGSFSRWGKTKEDDPQFSPFGPEIADIEISTICHKACPQCYKSNTAQGHNMSLETFKQIFHKFPRVLTQIAFGIGSIDSNPDLFDIMDYCRHNDYQEIIPNITINGDRMTADLYEKLTRICGAVAVSNYSKDTCYNAVLALSSWKDELDDAATLKQVNIHQILSDTTYDTCMSLLDDMSTDPRLVERLNAVVFLLLKPKGNRNTFQQLRSMEKYKALIDKALDNNLRIGFDSCGASSFLDAVKDRPNYKLYEQLAEPCESTLFSIYLNSEGLVVPCSFCEGEESFKNPIDIKNENIFLKDIWYSDLFINFRAQLQDSHERYGCRRCPVFDLEMK